MKSILKSLLLHPSEKKWGNYKTQFKDFFIQRDANFDAIITILEEFQTQFDTSMDWPALYGELTASGDADLLRYIQASIEDAETPAYAEDTHFVAYLGICENSITMEEAQRAARSFAGTLNASKKDRTSIMEAVDSLQVQLSKIRTKSLRQQMSASTFMDGEHGNNLPEIYEKNRKQREAGVSNYFPLPFLELSNLKPKPGDLIVVGAFTSQGKSIWLRFLVYYFAVTYGINTVFLTFEMDHDTIRTLFSILHANNKAIFPNTPVIKLEDFFNGTLTEEEYDFLMNKAEKDLLNNPNYGIIYIEQPGKSRFRLSDLHQLVRKVETENMEVHAVAVDYLTMMYPIEGERGKPSSDDFNQLFKDYKNTALAHRNAKGELKPFMALTAAQISRQGFEEAKKNEGVYEISAMSHYSEIERSSDILLSSYAPPEFRAIGKIRLQDLKNRNGAVNGVPLDLHCGYAEGYTVGAIKARTEEETMSVLRNLQL